MGSLAQNAGCLAFRTPEEIRPSSSYMSYCDSSGFLFANEAGIVQDFWGQTHPKKIVEMSGAGIELSATNKHCLAS